MLRSVIMPWILVAAGSYPVGAQVVNPDHFIVTPQQLSQHLHDKDLVILQIGPEPAYRAAHIANARFLKLADISTPFSPGTLNLEMPDEPTLRANLERYGISDRSHVVVVFDSEWVSPTTRAVLTLEYAGLGDRVAMLDGGLAAWRRAGLPVTADSTPVPTPGRITTRFMPTLIVDYAYVQAHRDAAHARVFDARDTSFYNGPAQANRSAGHIPGARSLPFTSFHDDNNVWLSKAAIEQKFRAAGVEPGDTVVAYCHVGQQATVVIVAAQLTGHPARLYDGSFQDWTMRKLPTEGGH